jgi:hypothetical protein
LASAPERRARSRFERPARDTGIASRACKLARSSSSRENRITPGVMSNPFGVPFNFADVIVMPLLLRIGVDTGIRQTRAMARVRHSVVLHLEFVSGRSTSASAANPVSG